MTDEVTTPPDRTALLAAFKQPFKYDPDTGRVTDGENTLVLEIRGFGHLTKHFSGDGEAACKAQDSIGNLVAGLLSEASAAPLNPLEVVKAGMAKAMSPGEYTKLLDNIENLHGGYPKEHLNEAIYRVLSNVDVDEMTDGIPNRIPVTSVIDQSLVWSDTAEGRDYWSGLVERLREEGSEAGWFN